MRARGFGNGCAVPTLDHLGTRHTEAEHEPAAGEVVERHAPPSPWRSGVRAESCTRLVPSRSRGRRGAPPRQRRQGVGPLGLRRPDRVEAEALGLGDGLPALRPAAPRPSSRCACRASRARKLSQPRRRRLGPTIVAGEKDQPCPKPSSSPPPARPSAGPTRARSSSAGPTTCRATIIKARRSTRCPQLDPQTVEDVIWGCGQPGGEAGYNVARVAALLAGLPDVPGVTVNRYCSSSLQTIRMAAHAIKAGEGDVFVAGGVETVSRFHVRRVRHRPAQPAVRRRRGPHRRAHQRGADGWDAARRPARHLHRHGPDGRERRLAENVGREEMDEFAARSQQRAVAAQENGFFEREITPVTLPDGTVVTKDDGPRAGTTVEKLAELKPVFRPDGKVTAGNACPLNDGAAAVVVMSDTKAERARHHPAGPHRGVAACPASTPRSWASARSRRAARRSSGPA